MSQVESFCLKLSHVESSYLKEEIVFASLLVRDHLGRHQSDTNLGKDCNELQDEVIDPDNPEEIVESWHFVWGNEKCTQRKIDVQEHEVDEQNAGDQIN